MLRYRNWLVPSLTLCLFGLAVSGCSKSSPTTPKTPPSINGTYKIDGPSTAFGGSEVLNYNGVFGTMFITNQSGGTATDSVALMLLDFGSIAMSVDSVPSDSLLAVSDSLSPNDTVPPAATIPAAQVQVATNGTFSVTFTGTATSPDVAACNPSCAYQLKITGSVGSTGTLTGNYAETWANGVNVEKGTFTGKPQ